MRMPWALTAALAVAMAALAHPAQAASDTKLAQKMTTAREVYRELVSLPEREIPEALQRDCKCVAVIPGVIKGAIGWGVRFGQGVMTCRGDKGWGPPSFISLRGGSFGFQLGAQGTDVVLFFMNERGARSLVESKFTVGGGASVAAGPLGRHAEADTDVRFNAEIYSYARSKGLFAGVSLEGARLAPDDNANRKYYGEKVEAAALLFDRRAPRIPDEARAFLEALP